MGKGKLFLLCASLGLIIGIFSSFIIKPKNGSDLHQVFIGIQTDITEQKSFTEFKENFGKSPNIVALNIDWEAFFPHAPLKAFIKTKSIPFIRWNALEENSFEAFSLKNITLGLWDDYINEWAEAAKQFEYTLLISFSPGINSISYKNSIFYTPEIAEDYKKALEHVISIFKETGAYNVLWVYETDIIQTQKTDWIHPKLAYPGENYIDWIAINGHNYGNTKNWSSWQSVEQLFMESINEVSLMAPETPIMLRGLSTVSDKNHSSYNWFLNIPLFLESSLKRVNAIVFNDINNIPKSVLKQFKKEAVFKSNIASFSETQPFVSESSYPFETNSSVKEINGDLNDWDTNQFQVLNDRSQLIKGAQFWAGKSDFSAKTNWQARKDGLYFAIQFQDDTAHVNPYLNTDMRNGDSIVIQIGNGISNQLSMENSVLQFGLYIDQNKEIILKNLRSNKILNRSNVAVSYKENHLIIEGQLLWGDLKPFSYAFLDQLEIVTIFNDLDNPQQQYPSQFKMVFVPKSLSNN